MQPRAIAPIRGGKRDQEETIISPFLSSYFLGSRDYFIEKSLAGNGVNCWLLLLYLVSLIEFTL
jgi:hypothetical protein